MEAGILNVGGLEHVLQTNWAEVMDSRAVMLAVLDYVVNTEFKKLIQDEIPKRHNFLTVSSFKLECDADQEWFDVAVEFTAPKDDGVVVGTAVVELHLDGRFFFREWYGSHLCPRKS